VDPEESLAMTPVDGARLTLAGRDGVPGRIHCQSGGPSFTYESLKTPPGAEDRVGPEFDVLRSTIDLYGGEPEFVGDPETATFRVAYRDDDRVLFLEAGEREGPFVFLEVEREGLAWSRAGFGGCPLRGDRPAGYGIATWSFDPAYPKPKSNSRTLHLIATEGACASGQSPIGRMAPAFVFLEPRLVRVELFVKHRSGGQDCQGNPPTQVSLRLPLPLGERKVRDVNRPTGAGG
jgi:hypothetical protein